ncbi:unnamed protein product [Phytophthora fragariaefolia]|uniref:Unnamed protein product n=1 Tax=Phytophthora fragariaefolia TaxID=1490495 RepID=A0A9W6XM58_9STRA|nr:unnamed protein product [Phytophthora fragariaefolia]
MRAPDCTQSVQWLREAWEDEILLVVLTHDERDDETKDDAGQSKITQATGEDSVDDDGPHNSGHVESGKGCGKDDSWDVKEDIDSGSSKDQGERASEPMTTVRGLRVTHPHVRKRIARQRSVATGSMTKTAGWPVTMCGGGTTPAKQRAALNEQEGSAVYPPSADACVG